MVARSARPLKAGDEAWPDVQMPFALVAHLLGALDSGHLRLS